MKNLIGMTFLGLSLSFLCSCTQEGKIKDLALETATKTFTEELAQEASAHIVGKETFKANYVSTIKSRSPIEVKKVSVMDQMGTAEVQVQAVNEKARIALMEIIEKQKNDNAFMLNLTNALGLIYGQMHMTVENYSERTYDIQFRKVNGDWKAVTVTNRASKSAGQ